MRSILVTSCLFLAPSLAFAEWKPPAPYDQIPVIDDCTRTNGDIAVARLTPTGRVILYCSAKAAQVNALHDGAGHFYYVHEFGHHVLNTDNERAVDVWAAKQLAGEPDGERYLRAAIAHFRARGLEFNARYGTAIERAERIAQAAKDAGLDLDAGGRDRDRDDDTRDRDEDERYRVKLQIFRKIPGNTGMRGTVYIDDVRVGTIDNLDRPRTLDLGRLTPGEHDFEIRDVSGYQIYPNLAVGRRFVRGEECSGTFYVSERETFELDALYDGAYLECDFR